MKTTANSAMEGVELQQQDQGTSSKGQQDEDKVWRQLHALLLETEVMEGKLVCGNCGHEYGIKEGIANFLLPGHLV